MVKVTCKLSDLKQASGKIKNAGLQSRFIVVSTLVRVAYEQGELSLMATDIDNLVSVGIPAQAEGLESCEAYVSIDKFCNLVDRFDKGDEVSISFTDDGLVIQCGNAKSEFTLALSQDMFERTSIPNVETSAVDYDKLQTFLKISPSALSGNNNVPALANYYLSEDILTACQTRVCRLQFNLLNATVTLPPTLVKLLRLLDNTEQLAFGMSEQGLVFTDGNVSILGLDVSERNERLLSQMREYTERSDCGSQILFKKEDLLSALNRLTLFVSERDRFACKLSFTDGVMVVATLDGKSHEGIEVSAVSEKVDWDFTCTVKIDALMELFKVLSEDEVLLSFGADDVILLSVNGCVMVTTLIRS